MTTPGVFEVKKVTSFQDLVDGKVTTLCESDLAFQSGTDIIQLTYKDSEDERKFEIKPGFYTLAEDSSGLKTSKIEFKKRDLLEDVTSTRSIISEARLFFGKLEIYEKLKRPKKRGVLLYSEPGCHAKGTKILMSDGNVKNVEDIKVNDCVMGPDSLPRTVLKLVSGRDKMIKVIPQKGTPFVVNWNHIQTFRYSSNKNRDFHLQNVHIPMRLMLKDDFQSIKNRNLNRFKLIRSNLITFPTQDTSLSVPPYILGLWLGDGSSHSPHLCSMDPEIIDAWSSYGIENQTELRIKHHKNNLLLKGISLVGPPNKKGLNHIRNAFRKHKLMGTNITKFIPQEYLLSSKENRLELLAGLLDTDGHYKTGGGFGIVSKYKALAQQYAFLARSLGFGAVVYPRMKTCTNSKKKTRKEYYDVSIMGELDQIPTRVLRKKALARKQIKDVLVTGYKTEILPEDDFYGFTVDGDHQYLLEDFTITHNCGKSSSIEKFCVDFAVEDPGTVVIVWPTSEIEADSISHFFAHRAEYSTECTRVILIIEDIGGREPGDYRGSQGVNSGLLNLLDGIGVTFKLPTFIVATTNHPEALLQALADRPGRFDRLIKLEAPTHDEKIRLLTFISKRELSDEEKEYLGKKGTEEFSVAHLEEIAIRSLLHDKTYIEVIQEMIEHSNLFKKNFEETEDLGFGFGKRH